MDPDVDKQYKQKYFPVGGLPPTHIRRPSHDEIHSGYSIQEYHGTNLPDPISTLTKSLNSLSFLQIEPEDPDKPCYLSSIPDELLLNILLHLSLTSLSSLSRLSLVCKKLLALSQGENSLYKALCFHYFRAFDTPATLLARIPEYNNDWRRMLIERPRLRFDGCYIATCHYLRPGMNDLSWNTPIHTVTYFRFIRFYPDGTCITVLTTVEPRDVVYSVSWIGMAGLKGVSEGIWRMTESGAVSIEVSGPRGYTFIKDLQVWWNEMWVNGRSRVLREGSITS
jgi:F-box protein 9